MASHPEISVHLAEIASWKALRTNERQAVLAALRQFDVLSARVAELEGALGDIAARENGYTYEDDHGILNDVRRIARNTLLRESP